MLVFSSEIRDNERGMRLRRVFDYESDLQNPECEMSVKQPHGNVKKMLHLHKDCRQVQSSGNKRGKSPKLGSITLISEAEEVSLSKSKTG
jgi:hypothetical protein